MPAWRSRRRTRSALAPAGFAFLLLALAGAILPAAPARAADDPDTPIVSPAPPASYTRAYLVLGAGAALTITSFVLAEEADAAYARYEDESDVDRMEDAFQDAKRLDRISAAALIAGQGALALGIYWRFLRRPRSDARLGSEAGAAPAWSFAPVAMRDGAPGIAAHVRF
jgi:hypothetical protein